MGDKQKVEASDNSSALAVNGDNITINQGLDVSSVRELFEFLFELNFPKLQEIAQKEAEHRCQKFCNVLTSKLKKIQAEIDEKKLSDPNTQYIMNDLAFTAARRGDSCDIDKLTTLFAEHLKKASQKDFHLQLIEDAINAITRLNTTQIQSLGAKYAITKLILPNPFTFEHINHVCKKIMSPIPEAIHFNFYHFEHLKTLGLIHNTHIQTSPDIPPNLKETKIFKDKDYKAALAYTQKKQLTHIGKFLSIASYSYFSLMELTNLGTLIGSLCFKNLIDIDPYKNFR